MISPFKKELSLLAQSSGYGSKTSIFEYIIYFYGYGFRTDTFILITLFVLLIWSLFGVYRFMRTELKMRTSPLGWTFFLIFIIFYCGGISSENTQLWSQSQLTILDSWYIGPINVQQFFTIALLISVSTCYMMFFSDNLSITRYRMMHFHFTKGNLSKAGELVPRWFISYIFAIIAGFVLIYLQPKIRLNTEIVSMVIGLSSLLLFLLRDLAILHYFSLAPDNRQAFVATLFYLIILYVLLPVLFNTARLDMTGLFYPIYNIVELKHLIPISIQIIIVAIFLFIRWRKADVSKVASSGAA